MAESEKITVTWASWGSAARFEGQEREIEAFSKRYPNIEVKKMFLPWPGYHEKLMTMSMADTAPDVMMVSNYFMSEFAKDCLPLGNYMDGDEIYLKNFPDASILPQYYWEGNLIALPTGLQIMLMCYNTDMFDSGGLSRPNKGWTWNAFTEYAKELTRDTNQDGKIDQYGTANMWPYNWLYFMILPLWGGRIWDEGITRCAINTDQSANCFESLKEIYSEYGPEPVAGDILAEMGKLFVMGKLATMPTFSNTYFTGEWIKAADFNIGFAPMPVKEVEGRMQGVSVMPQAALAISRNTKYPEAAWSLLKFVTTDIEAHKVQGLQRGSPPYEPIMAEYSNYIPELLKGQYEVHLEAATLPHFEPQLPAPVEMQAWDIIASELTLFYKGKQTISTTLTNIEEKCNELLAATK